MRTSTEISIDIKDLNKKIESLNSEIAEKEESLQKLREGNAKLLAMHAGKDRKPQSLNVQIRNIRDAEIEIEQIKTAVEILETQLGDFEEERHISEIHGDLQANYYPQAKLYLEKAGEIQRRIGEAVKLTDEITSLIKEFMSLPDPLSALHGSLSRLSTKEQYKTLGFDFDSEALKYKQFNAIAADEKRISALPKILKYFSDTFYGIEVGGPSASSKLRAIGDRIPEKSVRKEGPVYIGGGPQTRIEPGGAPDIERHPERYAEADVRKHGIEAVNRR